MEEEGENNYFDEMGVQKRSERDILSFMRNSNLLQANNHKSGDNIDEKSVNGKDQDIIYSEEDPLDKYMREMQEQTGQAPVQPEKQKITFTKGETLGNLDKSRTPAFIVSSSKGEKMGDDEEIDAADFYSSRK